jgi:hypothetical protein
MASAFDTVRQNLDQYGLGSLAQWAWGRFQEGASIDQIMVEVYQRPEFKSTYPEYEVLAQRGEAQSVQQLQYYRQQIKGMFKQYGIPDQFYDTNEELAQFAINNVSPAELSQRVSQAAQAVYSSSPETRSEMERLYSVKPGDLIAYWLDPAKAEPVIKQQFAAAQIAAQAINTGYGMLTQSEAEQFANQGVNPDQAQKAFSQVQAEQPLFNPINTGETAISRDVQLGAVLGNNAEDIQAVENRRSQRLAAFQGGRPGFAVGRQGIAGVGTNEQ